jgi:hypothetical protein
MNSLSIFVRLSTLLTVIYVKSSMLLTSLFDELTLTIFGTESSELQSKGGFSSYFGTQQLDSFGSYV